MMLKHNVLSELYECSGEYVSGEVISLKFGVTRSAVWKAIKSLRNEGYEILSVTNKGYCLVSEPDKLTELSVRSGLCTSVIGKSGKNDKSILVYAKTASTNTVAKQLAEEGAEEGTVVIAEEQTCGKGRMSRSFYSPPDLGLWMSVILRPCIAPSDALLTTVMTGVAVTEAIEKVTGKRPNIKWTNDIMANGKKLCGILTEMSVEAETNRMNFIIIGIGVNVNHTQEDFTPDIRSIATSLKIFCGRKYDRSYLARCILEKLDNEYICDSLGKNKNSLIERYKKSLNMLGRRICLIQGNKSYEVTAINIDDRAQLIVRYDDGRETVVNSGEVSIRLPG